MRHTGDPEIDSQLHQFGENLRAARQRAGLSQVRLGLRARLDRAAVSFLERAERSPDLPTILRVARATGVKPSVLLKDVGPIATGTRVPRDLVDSDADPATRFGANLKWARKRAVLSQEALAYRAEVDRAAISVFERGRRDPNLRTILKLAQALELPPSVLLRGIE
jgi:transcriptional regulator with XRE-family HTH domain